MSGEVYEHGAAIECGKGNVYHYDADSDEWVGFEGEWTGSMDEIPQPVTRIYILSAEEWAEYQALKKMHCPGRECGTWEECPRCFDAHGNPSQN